MAYRYHRMTPARRAALKKAQLAAAKKRKRNRRVATAVGVVAVTAAAGGGYARGRKKAKAREARVPQITLSGVKFDTVRPLKYTGGKEIDLIRHTAESQMFDENSRIDYGKIGSPIKSSKLTLTRRQAIITKRLAKAAEGKRTRRIIAVHRDGSVEPIGNKARYNIKRRMNYKPSKRSAEYKAARDRRNPPKWLRKRD